MLQILVSWTCIMSNKVTKCEKKQETKSSPVYLLGNWQSEHGTNLATSSSQISISQTCLISLKGGDEKSTELIKYRHLVSKNMQMLLNVIKILSIFQTCIIPGIIHGIVYIHQCLNYVGQVVRSDSAFTNKLSTSQLSFRWHMQIPFL